MPSGTLTILGCDGSYPGPGGAASGYLVRTAATTLWLDAGSGTFARLQELCFPGIIDAVVLSHEHPDHWHDLDAFAVRAVLQGARNRSWWSPRRGSGIAPISGPTALDWREAEAEGEIGVGDLKLQFAATDHGPPTMAVRIEKDDATPGDKPFAYSADTGPEWSVESLGEVGLLCEATYLKEQEGENRHLSGRQAGTMAAAAGVGDLLITHRMPSVEAEPLALEAAEAFGRPLYQAAPGLTFEW